jgi:hypothetical protein
LIVRVLADRGNGKGEGERRSIGLWEKNIYIYIYLVTTRLEPWAMPDAVNVEYPAVLDRIELKRRGKKKRA